MPAADSPTGTLLGGRYLLARQLGSGSSATVYLAEDQSLRREVAVKVLRAGLTSDGAFLKRFRAEAVAVAGLNHPHVLRVFDWGEAQGTAWLVTEYLSGGSLRDLLDERGTLQVAQVASIGAQAADGLAYAHARGFVHRDVKPTNLLFDDAGRVRITDFGVARALAEAQWTEPAEGLIGTVRYSSPEQALGRPVDPKSDVYALALVLYECLTGSVPFAGDSQVSTLNARVGAPLPSHPNLGRLEGILRLAAAPEPRDRLSAEELWSALTDVAASPGAAGPSGHRLGFTAPSPEELTDQHLAVTGAHGRHVATPAPQGATDETVVTPLADATIVGKPDAAVPAAPAAPPTDVVATPPAAPRRRKRWAVLAAVVVAGLLAYGAVLGTSKVTPTPHFVLPLEVGRSITDVEASLAAYHVRIATTARTSKTVPAGIVLAQSVKPGTRLAYGAHLTLSESLGPPPVPVPTVVGDTAAVATTKLTSAGFHVTAPASLAIYSTTTPSGEVLAVYSGNAPVTGNAAWGSPLQLQLSKGPPPIPVPKVVGLPGQTAVARLDQVGFVADVQHAFSTTVRSGNVISTSPAATRPLQPGHQVVVVVSLGPPITVPVLGHLSLSAAERLIVDAGLTILRVVGPTSATDWTSSPGAGTQVPKGTAVTLHAGK